MSDASVSRTALIKNQRGLHARAAAKFAKVAGEFEAEITVSRSGQSVSGRSIMGLMMLAAAPGSKIDLDARGGDAEAALEAICTLIDAKFDED